MFGFLEGGHNLLLLIRLDCSSPAYVMVYVQCVDLIIRKPMSIFYTALSHHSCLTLGFCGQFPSIIEQIYDAPSGPGLSWGLHYVSSCIKHRQ